MNYTTEKECKTHKLKKQNGFSVKINTIFTLNEAYLKLGLKDSRVKNTLKYIYSKTAGGAIFCDIYAGKCIWTALYNRNYTNNLSINMTPQEISRYIKRKNRAFGFVPKARLLEQKYWTNNGCLINMYDYCSIFNSYTYELIDMIEHSIHNTNICIKFILWLKDFPIMEKNDSLKYIPIFSQSTSPGLYDICVPNNEEWAMISRRFYPETCNYNDIKKIIDIKWTDKIEKGFFRGSGTGCCANNPRIAISYLSKLHPQLLDAGCIKLTQRDRLENGRLLFMDPKKFTPGLVEAVPMYTWSRYKYIINIKGNGAAYRLPFLFYLGSVVLHVQSKFVLWFEPLLINYHDYISIKEDLSNLIEVIEWCAKNDSECKKIAANGRAFADKWFNKDSISCYIQELCRAISPEPDAK